MSAAPAPFPWDEVLHVALCLLRWRPSDLWRATPREIAAALDASARNPTSRSDLLALMRAFPDREDTDPHG